MKVKLKDIVTSLFILSYMFSLIYTFLGHITILHEFLQIMMYLSIVFIVISIIVQMKFYSKNELLFFIVIICISILVFFKSKDSGLIKRFLLAYG